MTANCYIDEYNALKQYVIDRLVNKNHSVKSFECKKLPQAFLDMLNDQLTMPIIGEVIDHIEDAFTVSKMFYTDILCEDT